MKHQRRLDRFDLLWIASLVLLTTLYSIKYFNFSGHPQEDAAMLMRYSEHLAQGYGIVWNVGEKPVDGATDFLFMVLLAVFHIAGASLKTSVYLLDFGA